MKRQVRFLILSMVLLLGLTPLWGCPKKARLTTTQESQTDKTASSGAPLTESVEAPVSGDAEYRPSESVSTGKVADEVFQEQAAKTNTGLQPIYFDFDRSSIREDYRPVMKANAEWLKAHPGYKIKISGNSDERGTKEYNVALGQRRAANAKKYLTDLGVSASRISLISYGKERPVCTAGTEPCWQKNRRDDFVVVSR